MRFLVSIIAAALGLAAILPAQTETEPEPEVRSLDLNGRLVRYQIRGGFAVVEGDIIIGTAAMTNFRRRAITLPSSASSLLLNMDRSAWARDGFVPGGGGAEPAGSNVEFAILSPNYEWI